MAAFKVLLFVAAAVACAMADDAGRVKKDVLVGGYPYFAGVRAVGVDDGKYYPGKYEGVTAYTGGHYPYTYGAYPYTHHYGYNYPFAAKHVVY